ncbi:MAG: polysaccharide biosynthesis tyrosine autokinase [Planctomycetes bacterium]|nr:polysaccharide biosynthesis tyrosine autokinase [Planctomycetota bacterium]
MISVVIGLELKTPVYVAQVKMLVSGKKQVTSPYYKDIGSYGQSVVSLTQREIVNSNPVLERAVKVLGFHERPLDYEINFCSPIKALLIRLRRSLSFQPSLPTAQETEFIFRAAVENLRECVSIESIRDTDIFTISAKDFSPEAASMIANAVSRSYVIFDLEQQLVELRTQYGEKHQDVLLLKDHINAMENHLSGLPLPTIEAIGPASVKIIEQAQAPFAPASTRKSTTLVIAFFMSIFLGVMLAFGFEYIDTTFKSPQDVENFFPFPLLGFIPRVGNNGKTLIKEIQQTTPYTQSYHHLADQLYLLIKDKKLKSVLVTAASPLEGSTMILANLCTYLSATAGHKVHVIDANLRAPAVHKFLNISESPGLSDILEGKTTLEKATRNAGENLIALSAGKTSLNPVTLLGSVKLQEVIKSAMENADIVFVDYANLRHIKDVSILSSYLDGIVLVVNEGKTRRHVIKSLIAPLEQRKCNFIGVVLNNRTFAIPRILYKWV